MSTHKIAISSGYYSKVIPDELMELIVKEVNSEIYEGGTEEASVGGAYENSFLDLKIRNSKLSWFYEEHWVTSIFAHYFNTINREIYEYDLTYLSGLQIGTYEVGGHYTWHCDYGTSQDENHTRKLSATLLVNDPSEFEGGDLEIIDYHGQTVKAPKEKGSIIIFDSRIPHRVTEVTKGKRISIVGWMYGPKLK
jgi:PKHD-type hydroxylase